MLDEKEMDKIVRRGEDGRNVCHPSGGDFRSREPVLEKKHMELFLGMYDS